MVRGERHESGGPCPATQLSAALATACRQPPSNPAPFCPHRSILSSPPIVHQVRQLRLHDVERVVRCGAELLSRHARKLDADEREC